MAERVAKLASKTHKDRVNEFNSKLEALSEHHDIPKVCHDVQVTFATIRLTCGDLGWAGITLALSVVNTITPPLGSFRFAIILINPRLLP
jgi:hypothetical protein